MKVLILSPRLDIPFKKAGLQQGSSGISTLRTHWQNFVLNLEAYHHQKGDQVVTLTAPRWTFNFSLVQQYNPDRAYVPHVEQHNFGGDSRCRYYMQTVFPWLFTIDPIGWGGGASFVNEDFVATEDHGKTFAKFQARMSRGDSKFEQPSDTKFEMTERFIFCPLQIPHDETLRWHSNVQVADLADQLCDWSQRSKVPVVFKSHPANPSSLHPIKELVGDRAVWLDEANIHNIMKQAYAVYVINSGTGLEAMTHEVPVVSFGRAEYGNAVIKGNIEDLEKTFESVCLIDRKEMVIKYKQFYNWFINEVCYDSTNLKDFLRLG